MRIELVYYYAHMTPEHYEWSVGRWERYIEEPPRRAVAETEDGGRVEIYEPLTPEWEAANIRHGAIVYDPRRRFSYRATIDPETRELDYLEVVIDGAHEVSRLQGRQVSLPIERLHKVVREFVIENLRADAEAGRRVIALVLPGGLADGDGSKGNPPPSEEIVRLMSKEHGLGLDRSAVAARYGRKVRTVDRWIARARKELPDLMPAARRGRAAKTPDATAPGSQNGATK